MFRLQARTWRNPWATAAIAAVLVSGCGGQNAEQEDLVNDGDRPVPAGQNMDGSANRPDGGGGATGTAGADSRRQAPDFSLPDLQGRQVSLADFRGKVVILDFWATWCPPCKAEIPHFIELQRDYGDKGLEIVGVSLDQNSKQVVPPFAEQYKINYTMLVEGHPVAASYGGVTGIPTTFIIDKQGRIVEKFVGYKPKADFETIATKLLSEG